LGVSTTTCVVAVASLSERDVNDGGNTLIWATLQTAASTASTTQTATQVRMCQSSWRRAPNPIPLL
jgi:hypothetical protein